MLDRYDQDMLLDYLEGELDADRRAQLEALLEQDSQLASLLSQMSADRAALRALPREELPGDLTQDLMQTLERRMLLDEPIDNSGPIPIARGRALPGEIPSPNRWGRIVGLTGLAASVAIAAGIVVITLGDDPLTQTANELASNEGDTEDALATTDNTVIEETDSAEGGRAGLANELAAEEGAKDATARKSVGAEIAALDATIGEPNTPAPATTAADKNNTDVVAGLADQIAHAENTPPAPPGLESIERLNRDADGIDTHATIALNLTRPSRQLVVYCDEPDTAREQLVQLAVNNGIAIVETDDEVIANAYRTAQANEGEALEGRGTKKLGNNYAVLVDPIQLDVLVNGLNNNADVAFDAAPNQNFTLSNQAAVLSHLPKVAPNLAAEVEEKDNGEFNDDFRQAADALKDPVEREKLKQSTTNNDAQTVVIRLPEDLGSPDANTLNRNNLFANQRNSLEYAGQSEEFQFDSQLASAELQRSREAERTPDQLAHKEGQPDEELPADPKPEHQPEADSGKPEDNANQAGGQNKPQLAKQESADLKAKRDERSLDPARRNWLMPYLPQAQTTPIFRLAGQPGQPSPELIPVIIERAPATTVNALRDREQRRYAARQNEQPAKPESDPVAADADVAGSDAEALKEQAETPAEPQAPAEAEPTETPAAED